MTSHWEGRRRYLVCMPLDEPRFFRYVTQADFDVSELASDRDAGKLRPRREDYAAHLGISTLDDLYDAIDKGSRMNRLRTKRDLLPYTHIAEISLTEDHGHACAQTGGNPHHHTVWGEPFSLRSRVEAIHTIDGQEV